MCIKTFQNGTPQKKRPDTIRTCIGKRDPITDEIVYNKKHLQVHGIVEKQSLKAPTILQCGASILFDKISSDNGLRTVLQKCFPAKWQIILTLAYYFASEGKAVYHIDTWSVLNKTPFINKISSQRVSDLCKLLSQDEQLRFFKEWMKFSVGNSEKYNAMDITSVSSYSALNEMVKYGYNRDKEKLPQINMLMITGNVSKIPCYYEILPGSIRDVNTLNKVLSDMKWIGAKQFHLVMDKGFFSAKNIDKLYKYRHKFIIGLPFVSSFADQCIKTVQDDIMNIENYCNINGNDLYATSFLDKWNGHRLYVHIYYDSTKADGEYREFSRRILDLKIELELNKLVKDHQNDYDKYFAIKETPKRGRKITLNTEAVETYRNRHAGYFILVSNDEKDPVEALKTYRKKDIVEKSFDNLKSSLESKRMRTHSKETMHGRFFLQFIALIIMMDIQNKMQKHDLYKKFTYPTLLNELKTLSMINYPGKHKATYTELTKNIKMIYSKFEVDSKTYV